ncbi:MAG: DNA polymerase III subunit delta [bacterium]
MGILTPQVLLHNWKIKKFANVYLFAEENTFEKELHVDLLNSFIFPEGPSPFNGEIFSFSQAAVSDILTSAMMLPFIGSKRFVQVKDLQEASSAQQKQLADGLESLPETTLLIIDICRPKRDIAGSYIVKKIQKIGEIVYFWRPRPEDLPRMVSKRVSEAGKTISPDAARFIVDDAGDDQMQIMHEIDKLLIYCADKKVIGLKETAEICGQTNLYNMFDLRDSLQARNTKKSIAVLHQLLYERVEPVKIIYSLYQAYRRMFLAKLMLERPGMHEEEVRASLNINNFYEKHFFSDLTQFDTEELAGYLERISDADEEIKTGKINPESKLTALVLEISGFDQFVKLKRKP